MHAELHLLGLHIGIWHTVFILDSVTILVFANGSLYTQ